jgi:hypothetical protein
MELARQLTVDEPKERTGGKAMNAKSNDNNYKELAAAIIKQATIDYKEYRLAKEAIKKRIKEIEKEALAATDEKTIITLEKKKKTLRKKFKLIQESIDEVDEFFKGSWFEMYCGVVGVDPEIIKNEVYKKVAV